MAKLPVAIGLSLCEQIIIEERTQNVTLVNCFSYRQAERFPSEPIPFVVFALLTDGFGEVTLEVGIERLDTMADIYRRAAKAQFKESLDSVRFIHRVRNCSFPISGDYQVTLLADGIFVAQRKIRILPKGDH